MSKRGPYKTYLGKIDNCKVPRQTQYNQRSLATPAEADQNGDEGEEGGDFCLEIAGVDESMNEDIYDVQTGANINDVQSEISEDGGMECEINLELKDDEEYYADDCIFSDEFDEFSTDVEAGVNNENSTETLSDSLLYEGAPITVGASLLLMITFSLTHHMTGEALADLLSLIACHCKSPNLCFVTLSKFKKQFSGLRSPLVCHYYCSSCFGVRDKNVLHCEECGLSMTKEQAEKSFFIESPISEQLKTLFSRKGFYELLSYPTTRKKKDDQNIEDILDGSEYRRHIEKGKFLSFKNHYSFTTNTDGVAIFRSSSFSIWPIYLQINELPPHLRTNSSNVIFAGLWFGESKPYMDSFLQPLKSSLKNIQSHGNTCITSQRGHTHAYPMTTEEYKLPNAHPPLRTSQSTTINARNAIRQKKPVMGVKGFSVFHDLEGFDIIKGVAVDYMHCVLLGVAKMLLNLWFDTSQKGHPYFCGKSLEQCEKRLLSIKPTMYVTRTPRSIGNHRKYWKASELRAWLLYYSAPVMSGVLPRNYLKHYMCLVRGIYLLLKHSISRQDITEAKQLLSIFVFYVDVLYGERYCTSNVHYLLHLPETVLWLGPLWATSCFAFENLNGFTKRLFHGTQNIAEQILSAVQVIQGIPTLKSKIPIGSPISALYGKMTHQQQIRGCRCEFAPGCFAIGAMKRRECGQNIHEDAAIASVLQGWAGRCEIFPRCEIQKQMIHSISYKRVTKRNTYTIFYLNANQEKCYGQVSYFFVNTPLCNSLCTTVCNFHLPTYWALVYKLPLSETTILDLSQDDCSINFPVPVKCPQISTLSKPLPYNFDVLPILEILEVVSCIDFDNDHNVLFVSHSPNRIEKD